MPIERHGGLDKIARHPNLGNSYLVWLSVSASIPIHASASLRVGKGITAFWRPELVPNQGAVGMPIADIYPKVDLSQVTYFN